MTNTRVSLRVLSPPLLVTPLRRPPPSLRMAKTRLGFPKSRLLLGLGVLLVAAGVGLFFSWEAVINHFINKEMVLRRESESFTIWRDTPIPMYMNFYLFNWSNPEQLGEEPPHLTELGPYRFMMTEEKRNISWNSNGTISYRIARRWFFAPESSRGSLDDVVTTLNVVALTAVHTIRDWSGIMKTPVEAMLSANSQKVFTRQRVGDLLFDGYEDPLLSFASTLPAFMGLNVPYDKFGWFYLRNSSSAFEGVFNMDTGERGLGNMGRLWRWNHDHETHFYEGVCDKIYGSAGELFPPGQTTTNHVEMFSADLCRTIRLEYESEAEVMGVRGMKYAGGPWNVDNGTLDPSNRCYCGGECPPVGALNVSSCRHGAPGFVSYPHFLHGDPYYRRQVSGLQPHPPAHTLYIVLEPKTGIPLDVAARFQINIRLSSVPGFSLYEEVPEVYMPMMWFEQRARISGELADRLQLVLSLPSKGVMAGVALASVGLFLLLIYTCLVLGQPKKTNYRGGETLLVEDFGAHSVQLTLIPKTREQRPA